jgi:hypothetical protein
VTNSEETDKQKNTHYDEHGNASEDRTNYDSMGNNGWLDCEIMSIVGESEFGALPQACDTKLGSVWIVNVAIKTPEIQLDETVASPSKKSTSSTNLAKETSLSGGDLVVLHSKQWSHPLLGIIQPWDPDYDLKLGANFSVNQSQHLKNMNIFYNDNCGDLTTANILICVDSGESLDDPNIGGWANQGAVHSGVTFSMAIIGNVMTYIRECQALMSLKLLNSTLREAVLRPPSALNGLSTRSIAAATTANQEEPLVNSSSENNANPNRGPANVSPKLWAALSADYNESQLKAIRTVCRRNDSDSSPRTPISLLQGPPGTGKTKTILAILSVLLSGALRPAQRTTKVIAGSSFRANDKTKGLLLTGNESGRRSRSDSLASDSGVGSGGGLKAGSGEKARPRVLVCAPSNTAVDELVFRILTQVRSYLSKRRIIFLISFFLLFFSRESSTKMVIVPMISM